MNSYYTHREYLRKELSKLDYSKPVTCLEFGTGEGSAVIFKEFTDKYPNLKVLSYESDSYWLSLIKDKYESANYNFFSVDSWQNFLEGFKFENFYDLVFVDQAPWEARILSIDFIKSFSKVIILHDYDYFNKGVCEDIYSTAKGSFFYSKYSKHFLFETYYSELPPTLVMTNKKNDFSKKYKNKFFNKIFRL